MAQGSPSPGRTDVTRLLLDLRHGRPEVLEQLFPLVYEELRRLARGQLAREHGPRTLDATSLVHEAYLKLADVERLDSSGRAHFMGIAARAMRQILVDRARRRRAAKRGGDWKQTVLTGKQLGAPQRGEELLALEDALQQLEAIDPRCRRVVEMKYFGDMTEAQIAVALSVTERTVQRDWARGRAWLHRQLYGNAS